MHNSAALLHLTRPLKPTREKHTENDQIHMVSFTVQRAFDDTIFNFKYLNSSKLGVEPRRLKASKLTWQFWRQVEKSHRYFQTWHSNNRHFSYWFCFTHEELDTSGHRITPCCKTNLNSSKVLSNQGAIEIQRGRGGKWNKTISRASGRQEGNRNSAGTKLIDP